MGGMLSPNRHMAIGRRVVAVENSVRSLRGRLGRSSVRTGASSVVALSRNIGRVITPIRIPSATAVLLLQLTEVAARPRVRALTLVSLVGSGFGTRRLRVSLRYHGASMSVVARSVSQLRLRSPPILLGIRRRARRAGIWRGTLARHGARPAVVALGCASARLPVLIPMKRRAHRVALESHGPSGIQGRNSRWRIRGGILGRGSRPGRRGIRVNVLSARLS